MGDQVIDHLSQERFIQGIENALIVKNADSAWISFITVQESPCFAQSQKDFPAVDCPIVRNRAIFRLPIYNRA